MSAINPVAILTCDGMDHHGKGDDHELIRTFQRHGVPAEHVVWDRPGRAWTDYQAVIIRSTWDYYQQKLPQFLDTLQKIEDTAVPLFNSSKTVRWNSTKTYLRDLNERGIAILETVWIKSADLDKVPSLIAERGWQESVLKPTVSAGGDHVYRLRPEEPFKRPDPGISDEWMLQPFAPEILEEGEWSFVFIDGAFSHTVLKTPAPGNFLVQTCHGGRKERKEPEPWMKKEAERIYKMCQQDSLFGRIDVIRRGRTLVVGEVEMVEPELFFGLGDLVAEKFYQAFKKRMRDLSHP